MKEDNKPIAPGEKDIRRCEQYYSEEGLMDKLRKVARKAGLKTVYATLLLYYVLLSKEVPVKEKGLILGALGYLILPLDLLPDSIPVAGFTDDLTALLYAIHAVRRYITDDIQAQARKKLQEWFSRVDEKELEEVVK